MPNTILIKKSSTAAAQPTAQQLAAGELAINTADGRLFAKNAAGTVVNLPVSSISGQAITPGTVSATSNATNPTTFSAGCRMLVYGDTFVGSSAVGAHTGVLPANTFDNTVDFAYMEALNCPPTQYKPLLFTTGYFAQLSLLPSRKIGVNTANPQADFQIVTGLDGIYDAELAEWNYPDTTSALAGTAQSEIFQVINGGYYYDSALSEYVQNEYVNLARFHCNSSYSRGSFSLSNSGTGAWENNVLQFFVHGSNYTHGYYGGNASDAGAAMIVTQGGDISKLQIGNLGSVPIEFFTNNAFRMVVGATGNVGIGQKTPNSRLVVKSAGTTMATTALNVTDSADTSLFFVRSDGFVGINNTGVGGGRLSIKGSGNTSNTAALHVLNSDNAPLLFMRDDGNVGLGISSPIGSRLVVKGAGTTSATSALNVTNSADTSLLFVGNDGRVGINYSGPDAVLVVKSKSTAAANGALKVLNSADSTLLYVGDDGSVGIKKSTLPVATLDVAGDIAAEQVNAEQINIGTSNVLDATATYGSIIGGLQSKASLYGEIAHAAGGFVSTEGTAQHRILVARGLTLSGAFTVSGSVFTRTGHSLTVGDTVKLSTTGALPTGLNTTTNYYVISAGLTGNTFQVSTTAGGAAILTSGTQSGTHTLIPTTSLTLNGATGLVTPARLVIPARSTWAFTLKISAYSSQNNQGGAWWVQGGLRRNLSSTIELETAAGYQNAEGSFGAPMSLIAVDADTINSALDIRVIGILNNSVRWAAVVDIIQVSFGTP